MTLSTYRRYTNNCIYLTIYASSWPSLAVGDVYEYLSPCSFLMSVLSPDHVIKTLEQLYFVYRENEPIIVHECNFS